MRERHEINVTAILRLFGAFVVHRLDTMLLLFSSSSVSTVVRLRNHGNAVAIAVAAAVVVALLVSIMVFFTDGNSAL